MRAALLIALAALSVGWAKVAVAAAPTWLTTLGLEGVFGDADGTADAARSAEREFLGSAHAALDEGDIAAAQRYFEAALAANRDSVEALVHLGLIHESFGRVPEAKAMYERALSLATLRAMATQGDAGAWDAIAAIARNQLERMAPPLPAEGDAQRYVIERFAIMAELADRGLVEASDAEARRAANLGALLPMTAPAPAALVFHPPPPAADVISRLADLAAFLERGVLTEEAYAHERTAILDALLPLEAGDRRLPEAGAAPALEQLLRDGLVSREEAEAEIAATLAGDGAQAILAEAPATTSPPPIPTAKPAREAAPAEATEDAAHPVGVHLASFRTPEQAEQGWNAMVTANGDVLAGLSPRIAEVDRGPDTGVFFEVQAGPLPSPAAAGVVCDTLIRRGLYCATIAF